MPGHGPKRGAPEHPASKPGFRQWLPQAGASADEWLASFKRQSTILKTEFVEAGTPAHAAAHIAKLAREGGWRSIATHANPLTAEIVGMLPAAIDTMHLTADYDKDALERCDAGLTGCECLVAQTGSVCVTTHSSGGRALSVLPPHHLVIARRGQMLPDLTAAYDLLAERYGAAGYPSFISFITGPSRTGDIERILVLGAHGPKRLTILLID